MEFSQNRSALWLSAVLFLLPVVTCALQSIQHVNARRGAVYITKTEQSLPKTPKELQCIASESGQKIAGSSQYFKRWRFFSEQTIASTRFHLSENLPDPPNAYGFGQLFFNLGAAADLGEMPSFADAGSRSAYALEFFCRSRLLADLLLDWKNPTMPAFCKEAFQHLEILSTQHTLVTPADEESIQKQCRIVSLGGGPGFDHLGVLLANTYATAGQGKTSIQTTVFDYEEGWASLVQSMDMAASLALEKGSQSKLNWGGKCDITKPLSHPSNAACLAKLQKTNIYICQYCVAENAKRLRESDYVFFSDLLKSVPEGTLFLFTETTPRIWPDLVDIVIKKCAGTGYQIGLPRNMRRGASGEQLVIQKKTGTTIGEDELLLVDRLREMNKLQEEKIKKGCMRQPKKIRGSK